MRTAFIMIALNVPVIALALPDDALCHGFWLEHGTVIDTTTNIAPMGPGLWIHRTREITPAENGGSNTPVDYYLEI
jgi:hypothetical protein